MQSLEYYSKSKDKWSEEETRQVRIEYEIDLLDVLQIAVNHKRTPGCIGHKLKTLGILTNHTMARGYDTYKSSDLYKEICDSYKKEDAEKKERKILEVKPKRQPMFPIQSLPVSVPVELPKRRLAYEIQELRKEINEMKGDVKRILFLMNAIYEFESQ